MSHLEAAPLFVVERQAADGRWCPSMISQDEEQAEAMLEGAPHGRLVRVESWRGRVLAVTDREGLVEPVG